MKKRRYTQKRQTFASLLVRALCMVMALSLAFAFLCGAYIKQTIHSQASEQIIEQASNMQRHINKIQEETDPRYRMQEIGAGLAHYLWYDITINDPLSFGGDEDLVQIGPQDSPDCYIAAALIGEDGMEASNRKLLWTRILFSEDDEYYDADRGWYLCDNEELQLPEIDKLYADYMELEQKSGLIDIFMTSAYVNREERTFIPHEGVIEYYFYPTEDHYTPLEVTDETELKTREIKIDVEKEGYELIDMHQGADSEYPRHAILSFAGVDKKQINDFVYMDGDVYDVSGWERDGSVTLYTRNEPIYIDGKLYFLELRLSVDYAAPQVRKLFWKWTLLFTAMTTAIALLWCWRKNVLNKAAYAFEDYQRDLTDNLAHDIKTPLMAISGYAENIQNGELSAEERRRYLSAILDNVAFTDSLISRALFLNHIGERNALKREDIRLEVLAEEIIQKYRLLLDEKNIAYSINGAAEIHADRASLETIVENLVSNAVKYTSENGSITVTLDKKRLTITNTVAQKIDTKELNRPFARGDEARSNVKGNGLGLSIAERTAHTNGYTLSLSCTDEIFKAELKF